MKIKVSNAEMYEINFPEEISGKDFRILLRRLFNIEKLMDRSNGIHTEISVSNEVGTGTTKKHKRKYRRKHKSKDFNRETIVQLLKAHYDHNQDVVRKEKAMNKIVEGIDVKQFLKSSTYYKQKYSIKPKEVGMKRFPNQSEIWKIPSLRLKK